MPVWIYIKTGKCLDLINEMLINSGNKLEIRLVSTLSAHDCCFVIPLM